MKTIKHVLVANSSLFVNNKLVLQSENPIFAKFLKEVYLHQQIKYPKYYKMDILSKLAFITSEVLLKNQELDYRPERIGIMLQNSSSTFVVDSKHQQSINNREAYFPSPANFVYTLPNVMTGEICIKNGFKGENVVFIEEKFHATALIDLLNIVFENNKADMMIAGYVEADSDNYKAFMFMVTKDNYKNLEATELEKIYNK